MSQSQNSKIQRCFFNFNCSINTDYEALISLIKHICALGFKIGNLGDDSICVEGSNVNRGAINRLFEVVRNLTTANEDKNRQQCIQENLHKRISNHDTASPKTRTSSEELSVNNVSKSCEDVGQTVSFEQEKLACDKTRLKSRKSSEHVPETNKSTSESVREQLFEGTDTKPSNIESGYNKPEQTSSVSQTDSDSETDRSGEHVSSPYQVVNDLNLDIKFDSSYSFISNIQDETAQSSKQVPCNNFVGRKARLTVKICQCDIFEIPIEAMVHFFNSKTLYNNRMNVLRKAGKEVERKFLDISIRKSVEIFSTEGGNLTTEKLIHVSVSSVTKVDNQESLERSLRHVLLKCLAEAARLGIKSMSFPSLLVLLQISDALSDLPKDTLARNCMKALKIFDFLVESLKLSPVECIFLVDENYVWIDAVKQIFEREWHVLPEESEIDCHRSFLMQYLKPKMPTAEQCDSEVNVEADREEQQKSEKSSSQHGDSDANNSGVDGEEEQKSGISTFERFDSDINNMEVDRENTQRPETSESLETGPLLEEPSKASSRSMHFNLLEKTLTLQVGYVNEMIPDLIIFLGEGDNVRPVLCHGVNISYLHLIEANECYEIMKSNISHVIRLQVKKREQETDLCKSWDDLMTFISMYREPFLKFKSILLSSDLLFKDDISELDLWQFLKFSHLTINELKKFPKFSTLILLTNGSTFEVVVPMAAQYIKKFEDDLQKSLPWEMRFDVSDDLFPKLNVKTIKIEYVIPKGLRKNHRGKWIFTEERANFNAILPYSIEGCIILRDLALAFLRNVTFHPRQTANKMNRVWDFKIIHVASERDLMQYNRHEIERFFSCLREELLALNVTTSNCTSGEWEEIKVFEAKHHIVVDNWQVRNESP